MTPLHWALGATVLIVVVMGMRAVYVALHDLRLTHVDAPISGLPEELDGYTIALVADLHYLPVVGLDRTLRALALTREARPDLVALLGDYGVSWRGQRALNRWCYARMMTDVGPSLQTLAAECETVAVLGNHDHYADAAGVECWLTALGARLLRNDAMRVTRGAASLVIGGVGDAMNDAVDAQAGCAGQPDHLPTVVLSHNPDAVLHFDDERRVDLTLSGHTHGGQVVIPLFGAPTTHSVICTRRHPSGWVPNARTSLFVSRGIGAQTPIRFHCPPELVLVRLRRRP
jgi:predicted MPP superfamily phosphohydrolase